MTAGLEAPGKSFPARFSHHLGLMSNQHKYLRILIIAMAL